MPVGAAKHRDDRGHSLRAPLDTGTLPKTGLVDKIIVLFGAGISRPEIRAGSALAAVAGPANNHHGVKIARLPRGLVGGLWDGCGPPRA